MAKTLEPGRTVGLCGGWPAFLLATLLLTISARADEAGTLAAGLGEVTRLRLPNGLDVILHATHRQPRVSVLVAYDAGTRDEPPNRRGLAELVKQMTNRGSRHIAANQSWTLLQNVGGSELKDWTDDDATCFAATVPASALATALWVESERMAFTLERFDDESLAIAKRILENERRSQPPSELEFRAAADAATWGEDHPYGRDLSGLDLARISLDDARWFYQARYRPAQAHLIVVGDFESAAARASIEKYFAPIVNPARVWTRNTPIGSGQVKARERNVGYSGQGYDALRVQWFVPNDASRRPSRDFVLGVLKARVRAAVARYKPGSVGLGVQVHAAGSVAVLDVVLSSDPLFNEIERAIRLQFDALWTDDFAALLEPAKRAATLELLWRAENPRSIARAHLQNVLVLGKPGAPSEELAEIQRMSVAEILALKPYFAEEKRTVVRLRRYGAVPATNPKPRSGPGPDDAEVEQ